MLHQRAFDHTSIGKLVRQGAATIWLFCEQIFYYTRMSPAEQLVQVTKLFVQLVITRGSDQNNIDDVTSCAANDFCQRANACIGPNTLAVLHARIQKFPRDPALNIYPRRHERSEKITFPAFINPEMRLKHSRRMHFFVTEFRFAQDFRFQLELDEFLHALALHEHFRSFLVNCDAQFVFLRKEERVRLQRKFKTELSE